MPRIGWHTTNSTSSVGDPCTIAVVDTTAGSRTPIPTAAGYRPGQRADARPPARAARPRPPATAPASAPMLRPPARAARRRPPARRSRRSWPAPLPASGAGPAGRATASRRLGARACDGAWSATIMPATTTQPMAWRSSLRRLAVGRGPRSSDGRPRPSRSPSPHGRAAAGRRCRRGAARERARLPRRHAGRRVARRPGGPRRVMVGSDLAGAAVALCLLVASPAWSLVVLSGLAGVVSAPLGAAVRAAVPNLVPAEALDRANASITRWRTGAFLAGPVLGGAGAAAFGSQAVFALSAVAFLGSAVDRRPPARLLRRRALP